MILLSTIIRLFEAEFLALYQDSLLPSHRKALDAMKACRTSASPAMLAQCTDGSSRLWVRELPHNDLKL